MKYSIRGSTALAADPTIIESINKYTLWRLITDRGLRLTTDRDTESILTFEVWLNTEEDRANLYEQLKVFIDEHGEDISWHECTHDEANPSSCVIKEEYRG